ncbi:uncharacterized protein LOC120896667 [Anopheles arabiensis]|uniref:uncharacterized protein LOC120896667 n=1 Tax=Anopheles arabiensis TaxID=7173 RepID=UPI001AAD51F9|nr:uncharacterized protein LOC120896667 [Anopheles arabiensis]
MMTTFASASYHGGQLQFSNKLPTLTLLSKMFLCHLLNPHIEIYTTKSFRGRPAIIVDKQKYLLMSENSKRIVWRCSSMATEKLKCPARIMQYKDTDQYTFPDKSVHQHAPLKRYKNINCQSSIDIMMHHH